MPEHEKFTVSQVGVIIKNGKCLILEFASHPGFWGLPGGRIDVGEKKCLESFQRELKEELNITKFKIIKLVDFDAWCTSDGRALSAAAWLVKCDVRNIKLSDEHSQLKWIKKGDLNKYNFLWPNARRMIINSFKIIKSKRNE
jgi:8-oxo-dGTP pyrophosphatase MutT (NUDIX family)